MTPDQAKQIQRDYAAATGLPVAASLTLDSANSIQFSLIPPGQFMMGLLDDPQHAPLQEAPHHVTLTHAFYLATTPITVAQFAAFIAQSHLQTLAEKSGGAAVRANNSWRWEPGASWRNPGFEQSPSDPAVAITWLDAVAFCDWYSKKIGCQVRLPTSAEWEYACRSGSSTKYYLGDASSDLDKAGWYDANSGGRTHPVAQKLPNAWGLYDMHGNASQWCQDWYAETITTAAASADAVDPHGPDTGLGRIKHGGSWLAPDFVTRSGYSFERNRPNGADSVEGFRILLEVPLPSTSPQASQSAHANLINLLKLIDPAKDAVSGEWQLHDGNLTCPATQFVQIEFPYSPPAEYDYRLVFMLTGGQHDIDVVASLMNTHFSWHYGKRNQSCAFADVNGFGLYDPQNPTFSTPGILEHNTQYTVILKVRKTFVEASLNGKAISRLDTTANKLSANHFDTLHDPDSLGVGTSACDITIQSADVIEITGQGKALR
jgi:sulfatase modifying factor 1